MAEKLTWFEAPEVAEIALNYIEQYHSHLSRHEIQMRYLFAYPGLGKGRGRKRFGTVSIVSGEAAYLADTCRFYGGAPLSGRPIDPMETLKVPDPPTAFFKLTTNYGAWQTLKRAEREAWVDHQLCHCGIEISESGQVMLSLVPHTLEEFDSVVERHGLWYPDVNSMALRMKRHADQVVMPLMMVSHG